MLFPLTAKYTRKEYADGYPAAAPPPSRSAVPVPYIAAQYCRAVAQVGYTLNEQERSCNGKDSAKHGKFVLENMLLKSIMADTVQADSCRVEKA
jgi:hypothetical protein